MNQHMDRRLRIAGIGLASAALLGCGVTLTGCEDAYDADTEIDTPTNTDGTNTGMGTGTGVNTPAAPRNTTPGSQTTPPERSPMEEPGEVDPVEPME